MMLAPALLAVLLLVFPWEYCLNLRSVVPYCSGKSYTLEAEEAVAECVPVETHTPEKNKHGATHGRLCILVVIFLECEF